MIMMRRAQAEALARAVLLCAALVSTEATCTSSDVNACGGKAKGLCLWSKKQSNSGSYMCECMAGWDGSACHHDITKFEYCVVGATPGEATRGCMHGAPCDKKHLEHKLFGMVTESKHRYCKCPTGFWGHWCENYPVCQCAHGAVVAEEDCSADAATNCTSCIGGYKLATSRVNANQKSCVAKKCTCNNGVAAAGSYCSVDGTEICNRCNPGYHKDEDTSDQTVFCQANVCTCDGGDPVKADQCYSHDAELCVGVSGADNSCKPGYNFNVARRRCTIPSRAPTMGTGAPSMAPTTPTQTPTAPTLSPTLTPTAVRTACDRNPCSKGTTCVVANTRAGFTCAKAGGTTAPPAPAAGGACAGNPCRAYNGKVTGTCRPGRDASSYTCACLPNYKSVDASKQKCCYSQCADGPVTGYIKRTNDCKQTCPKPGQPAVRTRVPVASRTRRPVSGGDGTPAGRTRPPTAVPPPSASSSYTAAPSAAPPPGTMKSAGDDLTEQVVDKSAGKDSGGTSTVVAVVIVIILGLIGGLGFIQAKKRKATGVGGEGDSAATAPKDTAPGVQAEEAGAPKTAGAPVEEKAPYNEWN